MTPEIIQALIDASAPLVANPLPWSELSPEQQGVFRALMPQPSFTPDQREWLSLWWLPVTQEQVDGYNALLPANTRLAPREDIHGNLFLSVDVLSDVLDNGRLSVLATVLDDLPLTYKATEEWPLSDPEE